MVMALVFMMAPDMEIIYDLGFEILNIYLISLTLTTNSI